MERRYMRESLIVDTREHRTKEYASDVIKCQLEVIPGTLSYGDYCLNVLDNNGRWRYPLVTRIGQSSRINPVVAVERKHPTELFQCLIYDSSDFDSERHFRFLDEVQRAMCCNSKLVIAIDESMEDIDSTLELYNFTTEDFNKLINIYKKRMKLQFVFLKDIQGDCNLNKIIKILQIFEARSKIFTKSAFLK